MRLDRHIKEKWNVLYYQLRKWKKVVGRTSLHWKKYNNICKYYLHLKIDVCSLAQ